MTFKFVVVSSSRDRTQYTYYVITEVEGRFVITEVEVKFVIDYT